MSTATKLTHDQIANRMLWATSSIANAQRDLRRTSPAVQSFLALRDNTSEDVRGSFGLCSALNHLTGEPAVQAYIAIEKSLEQIEDLVRDLQAQP